MNKIQIAQRGIKNNEYRDGYGVVRKSVSPLEKAGIITTNYWNNLKNSALGWIVPTSGSELTMLSVGPTISKISKAASKATKAAKVAKRQENVAKHMLDPDGPSKPFIDDVFGWEWPSGAPKYKLGGILKRVNK